MASKATKLTVFTVLIGVAVGMSVTSGTAEARQSLLRGAWCEFIGNDWNGIDQCLGPMWGGWLTYGHSVSSH